ncbi:MAG: heme-binding domain-containing protein [Phaeodactylibacter sp.]|nr:heme-binding domain-containing protein [Phaeodactylibacter sp.]
MSKIIKWVLLGLLAILVVIQFFRIDKTNPPVNAGEDFMAMAAPPAEVAELLKKACYDCHSHETKYPWYTNVAPVSWWIGHHIEEARGHLNFSTWKAYDAEKKAHKAEECAEELEKGLMPLKSYTRMHAEARLSDEQKERLIAWFKSVEEREKLGVK